MYFLKSTTIRTLHVMLLALLFVFGKVNNGSIAKLEKAHYVTNATWFPFMVYMEFYNMTPADNISHCAGALIRHIWVITHARCLLNISRVAMEYSFRKIYMYLGETNIKPVKTDHINIPCAMYSPDDLKQGILGYEIAVVKVCLGMKTGSTINPINVVSRKPKCMKKELYAFGYGNNNSDTRLRVGIVTRLEDDECKEVLKNFNTSRKLHYICVKPADGVPCDGDIGGPLVNFGKCEQVVVGVYSFRAMRSQSCLEDIMVYENLSDYIGFMEKVPIATLSNSHSKHCTSYLMEVILALCQYILDTRVQL